MRVVFYSRRVSLSLSYEDGSLHVLNNSKVNIELNTLTLEIRDLFQKPKYAKKQPLFIGLGFVLAINEKRFLVDLNNDEIKKHFIKFNKEYIEYNSSRHPNYKASTYNELNIRISYNKPSGKVEKLYLFKRMLIQDTDGNFTISLKPYHFRDNAPLLRKVLLSVKNKFIFIRNPIKGIHIYKQNKILQAKLDITGLSKALHEGIIDDEKAGLEINNLLKKLSKNEMLKLLDFILIDVPKETQKELLGEEYNKIAKHLSKRSLTNCLTKIYI